MVVDGVRGQWCKMRDGKDGRSTPGLRPVGRAQSFWQSLFESRRGDSVSIELGEDGDTSNDSAIDAGSNKIVRSLAERETAIAAILEGPSLGWTSDGRTITRDELYDR